MPDIFICYRREDSEGYAGRLHDPLLDHFGKRAVFIDVDNLYPGVDFEQVIQSTLLRSTIVLVVIGPRWIDSRLKNEGDYVRREIQAALKGKKRLIPILVGGAKVPSREKLPPELAALTGKNAVTLHHPTWRADVSRLITSLEKILARKKASSKSAPVAGSGVKRKQSPLAKSSTTSKAEPATGMKPRARVPKALAGGLGREGAAPASATASKKAAVPKKKGEQVSADTGSTAGNRRVAKRGQAATKGSAAGPHKQRRRGSEGVKPTAKKNSRKPSPTVRGGRKRTP